MGDRFSHGMGCPGIAGQGDRRRQEEKEPGAAVGEGFDQQQEDEGQQREDGEGQSGGRTDGTGQGAGEEGGAACNGKGSEAGHGVHLQWVKFPCAPGESMVD